MSRRPGQMMTYEEMARKKAMMELGPAAAPPPQSFVDASFIPGQEMDFGSSMRYPQSSVNQSMNAVFGGNPQQGMLDGVLSENPQQSFLDASSMMGGPAEAAAGGMTGMQKAGIGAQVGGGVLDALMRMQTRAPAARGAQMRFGRQGPTVAEQFRRG